ncbi:hypothetical protein LTR91_019927 [Friedmanniomyces endolithicus]|uniref:EKC/KEOPS complex subunit CGI121 n=1 Tax=Friedmanniomyces endolithicus TaxID=329885 RepID=A0AAN6H9T4_9PEZI|nr:hypothetical protein LTR91_019927 [Friedmanniomyces endolithicus]
METIVLPHLPDHHLHVCLFVKVHNAQFLRQQLLDGNVDFEYAFLDAAVLLSRQHVLAACFRAINGMLQDRLKSKNVHSEIVFSLSPNNNISDSFRRFGVSEITTEILAVKVGNDQMQVEEHLRKHVEGQAVPFTDEILTSIRNEARIQRAYRVETSSDQADAFIIGSMALKGS